MEQNLLDQYNMENMMERLRAIYPNELDSITVQKLKQNLGKSKKNHSILLSELEHLLTGNKKELETFLIQNGVKEIEPIKDFVERQFKGRLVLSSPQENIFIVQGDPNITVEVIKENGVYHLHTLTKEETINPDVALKNIESMNEEDAIQYLRSQGNNPGQITMMMLKREEKKQQTEKVIEEKPRQFVLKNDKVNQKIAAFVDSLTLAFIVGTFSGALFFFILQLLLKHLY